MDLRQCRRSVERESKDGWLGGEMGGWMYGEIGGWVMMYIYIYI